MFEYNAFGHTIFHFWPFIWRRTTNPPTQRSAEADVTHWCSAPRGRRRSLLCAFKFGQKQKLVEWMGQKMHFFVFVHPFCEALKISAPPPPSALPLSGKKRSPPPTGSESIKRVRGCSYSLKMGGYFCNQSQKYINECSFLGTIQSQSISVSQPFLSSKWVPLPSSGF